MSLLKRPYAYSKVENEDPEDRAHQQAQFLIYKVLEQADLQTWRGRPTKLRVRIRKLKIKIGKRLKTFMRKNMLLNISKVRIKLYRNIMAQLKILKRLIRGEEAMVSLPSPTLTG